MKKIITFLLLVITNISYSQNPNPLDFFPHHKNDIFEYETKDSYFQNIITNDSLGDDGKYYLENTYYGEMEVDTLNYEVLSFGYLLFKLDADSGDVWTISVDSINNRFVRAEVVSVFKANYLGESVIIKIIDNVGYEIINSDTLRGLYYGSYYLASKFGIIEKYEEPPFEPAYYMRGAKINGTIYGQITSIDAQYFLNHTDFHIYQNYPNPFNSQTLITFQIPKWGFVSLKVYDILGKEIATLVYEEKQVGKYQINFDASEFNLTSGIYVYILKAGNYIQSKKMIYLK